MVSWSAGTPTSRRTSRTTEPPGRQRPRRSATKSTGRGSSPRPTRRTCTSPTRSRKCSARRLSRCPGCSERFGTRGSNAEPAPTSIRGSHQHPDPAERSLTAGGAVGREVLPGPGSINTILRLPLESRVNDDVRGSCGPDLCREPRRGWPPARPSEICGVCTYLERWSPSLKTLGCSTSALLGAQPGSDGLGPATEPMLAEKPIEMGPHGSMRKAEPRRDFLVGKARRDEREHLRLPRSHPEPAE